MLFSRLTVSISEESTSEVDSVSLPIDRQTFRITTLGMGGLGCHDCITLAMRAARRSVIFAFTLAMCDLKVQVVCLA